MPDRSSIDACLAGKRLAMIGVSRSEKHFSRMLLRELVRCGYDAVPVNPAATEIEGRPCYANVGQVAPAPDWALIMTRPEAVPGAVRECAAAGIRRVWLYRMDKAKEAARLCEQHGITAATGCPFMFLPGTGFPHNFHAFLLKLAGRYPQPALGACA